jgi:hypothetical protein
MKWFVFAVICSVGMRLSATTELGIDGSVAIAYWSQNEIVFAADSRGTVGNSYHDTECKVRAFGDKLIFTATGRSSSGFDPGWDMYTLAEAQFRALTRKSTPDRIAEKLATAWGEGVKEEFDRLGIDALGGLKNQFIATGFFADFENDGTLLIYVSEVTFNIIPPSRLIITANPPRLDPLSSSQGIHQMGEEGIPEIIGELQAESTPRGKKWRDDIRSAVRQSNDPIATNAMGIVRAVIDGLPKTETDARGARFSKVGPPVAAVRLIKGKGIDWVAKGACCVPSEQKTQPQPKKPQPKMK